MFSEDSNVLLVLFLPIHHSAQCVRLWMFVCRHWAMEYQLWWLCILEQDKQENMVFMQWHLYRSISVMMSLQCTPAPTFCPYIIVQCQAVGVCMQTSNQGMPAMTAMYAGTGQDRKIWISLNVIFQLYWINFPRINRVFKIRTLIHQMTILIRKIQDCVYGKWNH